MDSRYGEKAYQSIRRFVIVRPLYGHCLCLYVDQSLNQQLGNVLTVKRPIFTYQHQGTSKPGVRSRDHAIIYTGVDPPKELPDEKKLLKKPIRVVPLNSRDKLALESRLNYAKIYTLEINVKVCFIGQVHENSIMDFKREYNMLYKPPPEDDTSFNHED
jgi:hypothetical protein